MRRVEPTDGLRSFLVSEPFEVTLISPTDGRRATETNRRWKLLEAQKIVGEVRLGLGALMIRTICSSSSSVCTTTSNRWRCEKPMVTQRSSSLEWSGSGFPGCPKRVTWAILTIRPSESAMQGFRVRKRGRQAETPAPDTRDGVITSVSRTIRWDRGLNISGPLTTAERSGSTDTGERPAR